MLTLGLQLIGQFLGQAAGFPWTNARTRCQPAGDRSGRTLGGMGSGPRQLEKAVLLFLARRGNAELGGEKFGPLSCGQGHGSDRSRGRRVSRCGRGSLEARRRAGPWPTCTRTDGSPAETMRSGPAGTTCGVRNVSRTGQCAGIRRVQLTAIRGKPRIWGTANPRYWASLDPRRATKQTALILDLGRFVRPFLTPDDPDTFERVVRERAHLGDSAGQTTLADRLITTVYPGTWSSPGTAAPMRRTVSGFSRQIPSSAQGKGPDDEPWHVFVSGCRPTCDGSVKAVVSSLKRQSAPAGAGASRAHRGPPGGEGKELLFAQACQGHVSVAPERVRAFSASARIMAITRARTYVLNGQRAPHTR